MRGALSLICRRPIDRAFKMTRKHPCDSGSDTFAINRQHTALLDEHDETLRAGRRLEVARPFPISIIGETRFSQMHPE